MTVLMETCYEEEAFENLGFLKCKCYRNVDNLQTGFLKRSSFDS